jgi:hypothetical protein
VNTSRALKDSRKELSIEVIGLAQLVMIATIELHIREYRIRARITSLCMGHCGKADESLEMRGEVA